MSTPIETPEQLVEELWPEIIEAYKFTVAPNMMPGLFPRSGPIPIRDPLLRRSPVSIVIPIPRSLFSDSEDIFEQTCALLKRRSLVYSAEEYKGNRRLIPPYADSSVKLLEVTCKPFTDVRLN
jgi:hypothetical protein